MDAVGLNPSEVGGGDMQILVPAQYPTAQPLPVVVQVFDKGTVVSSRWTCTPEERQALVDGADLLVSLVCTPEAHPPLAVGLILHEAD